MSDRIVVMRAGVIEQVGTPAEIYNLPRNAFVADFVGSSNLIRGRHRPDLRGDGLIAMETPIGSDRIWRRARTGAWSAADAFSTNRASAPEFRAAPRRPQCMARSRCIIASFRAISRK